VRHAVTGINRKRRKGLEDSSHARRDEVIDAAKVEPGAIVVILQVEVVEPCSGHQLNISGEIDLVLNIGGGHVGLEVVVRVGRALPKRHGRADHGVR